MQQLSSEEAWALLESKPGWGALTTLDEDGFPHTVAIGYFTLNGKIYSGCRAGTRKCRNLQRDARAAMMVHSEGSESGLQGAIFQGRARVVDDSVELLQLKSALAASKGDPAPTSVAPGIAYLELTPERIRSWKR